MKKKKLLVPALAVLAAAGLGTAWMMIGNSGQKVEMAAAVMEPVEDWYTEEGVVALGGEYQVMAQVSGRIKEICTEENARVEAGETLFVIDSADYEYSLALAESALAGYEAQLDLNRINQVMTTSPAEYLKTVKQELTAAQSVYEAAKTVYEADKVLYEAGEVARVTMETDKANYENAKSAWESARGRYEESSSLLEKYKAEGVDSANINSRFYDSEEKKLVSQIDAQKTTIAQLEDQISKCRVTAEQAGIVTKLPVADMSVIQAGQTAAVLGGLEETFVEADVLTNVAPHITEGTPVKVTLKLKGKDEAYEGEVSRIYDYAEKGTSSLGLNEYRVHVKIALKEPEALKKREGYGVSVEFLLYESSGSLTVPSGAVFEADGQKWVYQIRDGQAVKVPVETEYDTGIRSVIVSGLSEGDEVIKKADEEGIYEGAKVRR